MGNLRLALIIDAIDNSPATFKKFEQNARKAAHAVSERFEKISEVSEGITRSIAGLGLGVGVGFEIRDIVETGEAYEHMGAQAGLTEEQLDTLKKSIAETAIAAGISARELDAAWESGGKGRGLEAFTENAAGLARQIQIAGGHGDEFGQTFLQFGKIGVKSADDVNQAFATLREQLRGSSLEWKTIAPQIGSLGLQYSQAGHGGVEGMRDVGALLAMVGESTGRPKEAIGDTRNLLQILTPEGARDFTGKTGITIVPDWNHKTQTRSIPDIMADIEGVYQQPGGDGMILNGLGTNALGLKKFFDEIQRTGHSATFEDLLSRRGDPKKDKKTEDDLINSLPAVLLAMQGTVLEEGDVFNKATKPIWRFINAHIGIATGAATAGAAITGLGLAAKIMKPGFDLAIGVSTLLQSGLAGLALRAGILVSSALPVLGDAFIAVGAVIEATPIGWILTGIAGVGLALYELYKHWDGIKKWWHDWWGDAADDVVGANDKIEGSIKNPSVGFSRKKIGDATDSEASAMRLKGFTGNGMGNRISERINNALTGLSKAEQDKRAEQAMSYFEGQGWKPEAAAGITARIERESHFNEKAIGDDGAAIGALQWHRDRRDALADHFGKRVDQMSYPEQLAAINYELRSGNEQPAGRAIGGAGSADEAGRLSSSAYARPAHKEAEASATGSLAQDLMRRMGQGAQKAAQKVQLTVSGLPAGAKVTAASSGGEIDLSLGHHMVPAQ
jgi:hypothetical protein